MFKRLVQFAPAYDRRSPDPAKNYGIHGVKIRFILTGDKGVVQFLLYTNWHLSHVLNELGGAYEAPMPADLGYHSPVPIREGQTLMTDSCEYLDGKPCYYDGSTTAADRLWDVLRERGDEGVWQELEGYYGQVFGATEEG